MEISETERKLLINATKQLIEWNDRALDSLEESFFDMPQAKLDRLLSITEACSALGGPADTQALLMSLRDKLNRQIQEITSLDSDRLELSPDSIPFYRLDLYTLFNSDQIDPQEAQDYRELERRLRPPVS